ncbi:MAG: trypsin-like peptidase domain-containing protein [Nitrospirae bacterium]|nr:trypsin-like peptidase domain-containing protein [Nitrospirota bacterium]
MKTALESDKEAVTVRDPAVRFALTHLSGSRRGQTQEFVVDRLTIGTDPVNDLAFDPARDPAVSPRHAELSVENCELILRDRGSQTGVYVNHQCVTEIILQDNDLVTVGQGGPQLRVRVRPEAYASCKPFKDILCDCRDIATAAQRGWAVGVALFFRHLFSDLVFHATVPVRLLAGAIVLLPIALFAGLLYSQYAARAAYDQQMAALLKELQSVRLTQADLERKTAEERRRMGEALTARQAEIDRLVALLEEHQRHGTSPEEVQALTRRLKVLETERTGAEVLIKRYGPSVCFLYIASGFVEKDKPGIVPSVLLEYMGTGFLADGKGLIVTNRHIMEPWSMDPSATKLLRTGMEPKLVTLLAYFPGRPQPYDVSVVQVSNQVDVALGQLSPVPQGIAPIPIRKPAPQGIVGETVVVLGYPVGVEGVLARMDDNVAEALMKKPGQDLRRLVQDIADRNGIRPLATQGHIGDVLPDRIVYDAQTTGGASGSPVFNSRGEAIAVNAATMTRFGGASFGVPIQFGVELLTSAQRTE